MSTIATWPNLQFLINQVCSKFLIEFLWLVIVLQEFCKSLHSQVISHPARTFSDLPIVPGKTNCKYILASLQICV